MAYIKVDHSKFGSAANEVEEYVSFMKQRMKAANAEVAGLSSKWQGIDYHRFKKEWNEVTAAGSVHAEMIKAMEGYASFLRYAEQQYKDTQSRAISRAGRLPRF